MSSLTKKGYLLQKEKLNSQQLDSIKKELTIIPLTDPNYKSLITSYPAYIENEKAIWIPKMFGIEKFGIPEITESFKGKKWNKEINFNGNLFDNQIKPVDLLLKSCENKLGGILTLGTGQGKTVSLLYILSKLKGKTIIVVNKVPLMNQWIDEINKFLPNATVGIIKGKVANVDCDIVVGMLQSLSMIDYSESIFKDFMITVFDECHSTSSQVFSKSLFKLCSYYTIGLSATPERSDGCEKVFKWHLGEIVYQSKNQINGKPPVVSYINLHSNDYKEICIEQKYTGLKKIQFTSMLTDLVNMETRNVVICKCIKKLIKESNEKRKILVLSDRRNHLEIFYKLLKNDPQVTFTFGLFLGGMKLEDLNHTRTCSVILATYKAFGEGISEKDLDTILLTTPKKFIGHLENDGTSKKESGKLEQIIGRIFRKEHIERHPMIVDFRDNFSIYRNQSKQRSIFYKKHFSNNLIEKYTTINI